MRATLGRSGGRGAALSVCLLVLSVSVASAVLALAGVGCGGSSGASLEGTSWRLTDWSVDGLDPADFSITAEFADGRIGGTSAVNTYGGPYEAGADGAFGVGDVVATTMAGPEPDMRAETVYLDLLAGAKQYSVDGGTLTLADAEGKASLVFARAE
jgi:heat shock protein HslJ